MVTRRLLFLGLALLTAACVPERGRLNPLDPDTSADPQLTDLRVVRECSPCNHWRFYYRAPHGIRPRVGNSTIGVINIQPVPTPGGCYPYTPALRMSGPNQEYYGDLNLQFGTTYTFSFEGVMDFENRPMLTAPFTVSIPAYGSHPPVPVSVTPPSPAAGSRPTFSWSGLDPALAESLRILLFQNGIQIFSSASAGFGNLPPTALSYTYPDAAPALTSGSYEVQLGLAIKCTEAIQSFSAFFTVP